MFPIGPFLCGSIIESPLFRAYELSHHRIHRVYLKIPLFPIKVFHPLFIFFSLVLHIFPLIHTIPYLLRSQVSSFQVIHALYALTREVVNLLLSTPHSTVIPGVSLLVALLLSLVP